MRLTPKVKFQERVPLKRYSHYKIGGPARYFFIARTVEDLTIALREAKRRRLKVLIIGGATNLLLPDKGFAGLVILPQISILEARQNKVTAGAGVLMSELLNFTAHKKLSGLEWAGGLPGTVGGAIRGNAGCFGGEMKDKVVRVQSLNTKTLKLKTRSRRGCHFGYRTSIFKQENGREIVVSAALRLAPGDPRRVRASIREKINYRHARHPIEYPNIGSIFKNVPLTSVPKSLQQQVQHVVKNDPFPIIPAAYLIAEAGLKGMSLGGAMISPKHPNFIVNILAASQKDVLGLISLVKRGVRKKFRIILEEEVIRI